MADEGYQSHEFTLVRPPSPPVAASADQTLVKESGTAPTLGAVGTSLRLANLVEQLPLDEREAITLYFFEKWPLDRVAVTMERSPEQVAALLLSASKSLKTQLGPC